MEKTALDDGRPPDFGDHEMEIVGQNVPGHHKFRERVGCRIV